MSEKFQVNGLSEKDAKLKNSLNLQNSSIDTYSPSIFKIVLRNVFTIFTVILIPAILVLLALGVYRESFALIFFIVASSIINIAEEVRIKSRLNKIKKEFQNTATVIRDGKAKEISVNEIVEGDYINAKEGEAIIANGEVLLANYLSIDESAITGESDYLEKKKGQKLQAGSFVVTGECVYLAKKSDKNYLQSLSEKSTSFEVTPSSLEKIGRNLTYFFTLISITFAIFYIVTATYGSGEVSDTALALSITTIISSGIPQTLLILFILTYIVSVTKLAKKGIIVQKRGAIDDLSDVDVICIDKTGTITTNNMIVKNSIYNEIEKSEVAKLFHTAKDKLYGQNKTLKAILKYLSNEFKDSDSKEDKTFDQIPFTSKRKFSAFQINNSSIILGAKEKLTSYLNESKKNEVNQWIKDEEKLGRRIIMGIHFDKNIIDDLNNKNFEEKSDEFFLVSIEEELNPGIRTVLNHIKNQNIEVKVISGDSVQSVKKIANFIDLQSSKYVDLSDEDLSSDLVLNSNIFARSKPEDKAKIIRILRLNGKKVAMIGDGVNDVLGLKEADVAISMESGSKITRNVSDLILVNNDYKKIPEIFYEGDNIVFNLKLSSKIFFAKTIFIGIMAIFFGLTQTRLPLLPTSALIFSFLGSTLASYILTFSRQKISDQKSIGFINEVIFESLPYGIIMGISILIFNAQIDGRLSGDELSTAFVLCILIMSTAYTVILLWRERKIRRNIFLAVFLILSSFVAGNWIILTPYSEIIDERTRVIYLYSTLSFAGFILVLTILRSIHVKNILYFIGGLIVSLTLILTMIFMPARDYFAVDPVDLQFYDEIISIALIGVSAMVLWTLVYYILDKNFLKHSLKYEKSLRK